MYLSNSQKLIFPTADGEYGYIATKDKFLVEEIHTAINKCIGGVSVCTKEEYGDYLKKRSSGTAPDRKWREEIKGEDSMDCSMPPPLQESVPPADSPESGEAPAEEAKARKKTVGKFKKKKK